MACVEGRITENELGFWLSNFRFPVRSDDPRDDDKRDKEMERIRRRMQKWLVERHDLFVRAATHGCGNWGWIDVVKKEAPAEGSSAKP
jgi:hypothetical protein